jgi:hypothetical protein
MTDPGYDAIQWARENTDEDSVFVSDALYGWWLGGFAQRPTISAVDPQYLSLSRELGLAKNASYLLDTDYVIDNGLIQVREDGGHISRHNPMFLAMLNWTYFPYPFFNFNHDMTIVSLAKDDTVSFSLSQLPIIEMHSERTANSASIYLSKGNSLFTYTQIVTVYTNVTFAKMSITLENNADNLTLSTVLFGLETKGDLIDKGQTIGFFDEGAKVLGQLIFPKGQPTVTSNSLFYTFSGEPRIDIELWAGAFPISDSLSIYQDSESKADFLGTVLFDNLASYEEKETQIDHNWPHSLIVDVFDYRKALTDWNISYIACRDSSVLKKFASDPIFSRVFINAEVSVFRVKSSPR